MDRATIEFNFSKAKEQASKLETTAGRIRTISNSNVKSAMQDVSIAWKGENSQKYVSKGDVIAGKIVTVANGVTAVASTIRAVAKNIYDAEMEALRIEEERAYRARLAEEAKKKAEEEAAKSSSKNGKHTGGGGHF